MRSLVTSDFRKLLESLPVQVQEEARNNFQKWKTNPQSVGWKKLSGMKAEVYSVQIGMRYRAVGVVSKEHDAVAWMFIGSHETYNNWIEIHRKTTQNHWLNRSLRERLEIRRADEEAATPNNKNKNKPG